MNTFKRTNIPVWIIGCCLLVVGWGCSSESSLDRLPEEGTPVEVLAEIAGMTETKAAVADNDYDRSTFVSTDKIRIYKSGTGITAQQVDYDYNGSAWNAGNPLTLQAGATYQATYPSDYEGIQQDQSATDGSGFLKSNWLRSGAVTTRDGKLRFVNVGAFTHQNVKLTLEIKSVTTGGTWNGAFTNTRLSATGLLTLNGGDENIVLFQPDPAVRTWCGIAYPKGTSTMLTVLLTYQGVPYKATVSCELKAGIHYKYTLTLQDNKLVPQGSTIEGWKNGSDFTGGFNNGTTT